MYCKKCGNLLKDDLFCTSCGYQNILSDIKQSNDKNSAFEESSNYNSYQANSSKNKLWAILSGFMFFLSFIPLYKGYDKMTNYYSSNVYSSLNKNAYVGGDAYNYIINAEYATAFFVLSIGLALLGLGFLIVYYLSGRKAD